MMRHLIFLLLFLCGCGEQAPTARHKDVVALDAVPAAVLKAAQAEYPEVTFKTAWKTSEGYYEIRGKAKSGKIYEVELTETGKVMEVD